MFRQRTLQVLMVLFGLVYQLCWRDVVHVFLVPYEGKAHEQMLSTVMAILGLYLLLAVRNPSAHRSLISYAAWSGAAHAIVMSVQAWRGVLRASELPFHLAAAALGLVFILVVPPKTPALVAEKA